jgi:exonuclease III
MCICACIFTHSDLGEKGYAGIGLYSKKEPIKVTFGLGKKEFDTEGRVITAEYEKFYLVAACEYKFVVFIDIFSM